MSILDKKHVILDKKHVILAKIIFLLATALMNEILDTSGGLSELNLIQASNFKWTLLGTPNGSA